MTYDDAQAFINETNKLGSIPGLDTITELMKGLGNPQDKLRIIHLAGTNGKGSTISFLSSILACQGYSVGRYISPSVFSYREKFQILTYDRNTNNSNIEYISKEDVCRTLELIKPVCEDMVRDGYSHPTSFEIETAMAFVYMSWKQVDYLLLETGMGGKLDATNIIKNPICTVITSISMDHIQYLGDSLAQIAMEKAGIMKPNAPLITCNQDPEVMKVLDKKARELGIDIFLSDSLKSTNISYNCDHTEFSYITDNASRNYIINLLGKHQIVNAILALDTAKIIDNLGYKVSEEAIKKGLRLATCQGRFEKISNSPDIYIDGAHNEGAAISLRDSIEIYFTNRRLIFMIGVLADKDYKRMIQILAPLADTIITLTPDNPRALPSYKLAEEIRAYGVRVFDENYLEHATRRMYELAGKDDIVFAFGSLSFLGDLVISLEARKDERDD